MTQFTGCVSGSAIRLTPRQSRQERTDGVSRTRSSGPTWLLAARTALSKVRGPEYRELLADLEQVHTVLHRETALDRASEELRFSVWQALSDEAQRSPARRPWRGRPWSFLSGVLSGIGGSALAAGLAWLLIQPATNNTLQDLVRAHVRSLTPDHLIEVLSTDRHTVKPWFAGHADVSPVVADFEPQGYRLLGGRADYLDLQRAAVVVYQHGKHTINVFTWAAEGQPVMRDATLNGYHLAFWKDGNLRYCAISDTSWDELHTLERLLADLSAQDISQQR